MTATLHRPTTGPVVALIRVDRLRFHPRNIRHDLGDLRDLTASIAADGVLQPLLVHHRGTLLEVIDGHRRLAAARLAGLYQVPAMVVDELDDDEAIVRMLATTLRSGISREERRATIRTLIQEFGHTYAGLARRYGVAVSTVQAWAADPDARERDSIQRRRSGGRRIYPSRVRALADEWQERVDAGLSHEQQRELLAAVRDLASPRPDGTPTEGDQT